VPLNIFGSAAAETANGEFPVAAVAALAAIAKNAEEGVNAAQAYDTIRDFVSKPVSTVEAVVSAAAKNAIDTNAGVLRCV
jgi:pyruvate kinase